MRVIYDGVKAGRGPEVYGPVFRTVTEGMAAGARRYFCWAAQSCRWRRQAPV